MLQTGSWMETWCFLVAFLGKMLFLINDQRDAQIPFYVSIFVFNSLQVSSTSRQIMSIQPLVAVTVSVTVVCRSERPAHDTATNTE